VSLWLLVFFGCGGDDGVAESTDRVVDSAPSSETAPTGDTAQPPEPPACPTFGEAEAVGVLSDPVLTEVSGLVWGNGVLWAHNDSGGGSRLYGLSETGAVLQRVHFDPTVLVDWEDITRRGDHLWLADVGDNGANRGRVFLHEMAIPAPGADTASARARSAQWPDGPVDCEAVFADPVSGDLLLMSKVFDGIVTVARMPDPDADDSADPVPLEPVATVVFGNDGVGRTTLITGADMSPDGRFVVVRTYLAAWAFPRIPGEPWADTFGREPCEVPTGPEGQAEAIAWDERGIWTASEGEGVPLHRTSVAP